MADTAIASFTDGGTAVATDRIAAARSPFAAGDDRYLTPAYIKDYILGLANTWTATQTITPAANTSALAVSGYSLTGSDTTPLLNLAGTWNTTGVAKGILLNITDTASNASALLMDLQVGSASKISVSKSGTVSLGGATFYKQTASNYVEAGTGWSVVAASSNGVSLQAGSITVGSGSVIAFTNSGPTSAQDTILVRDAADTLALRRTTNAQTFRAYFSYTDASNYTRLALKTATTIHTIETESAGTGEANIDLALTPKGTGAVRFGTHSAVGAETVTGYITIKDSGGTERKLAVIS